MAKDLLPKLKHVMVISQIFTPVPILLSPRHWKPHTTPYHVCHCSLGQIYPLSIASHASH